MLRKVALGVSLLLAAYFASAAPLHAAELIMFEDPGCVWCRRWHAEIGPSYPNTAEGRQAPLRRLHIRDQELSGVALSQRITVTPTFVLTDDGAEIGRIVGYPGADFFYPMLDEILDKLPPLQPYTPPAGDRAALTTMGRCALT